MKKIFSHLSLLLYLTSISLFAEQTSTAKDENSYNVETLENFKQQPTVNTFFTDSNLKVRFRNEYRNRDREAASKRQSDAWVNGTFLDFTSGYWKNIIGFDISYHRVDAISSNPRKDSSFYLDGHSGFDHGAIPAIKLRYDNFDFKIGRFITDYGYGGWEYEIPMINGSSIRPTPITVEGFFFSNKFNDNFSLYTLYTKREIGSFDPGLKWDDAKVGVRNLSNELLDEKPKYSIGGVYDSKNGTILTLGSRYQEDVSNQFASKFSKLIPLSGKKMVKIDAIGLYADIIGDTKKIVKNLPGSMNADSVYVYSGQLSYIQDKTVLFSAIGYVSDKVAPNTGIVTDITFVGDQTLDRIHADMFSYSFGSMYQFTPEFTAGISVPITSGYLENEKIHKVEGIGLNFIFSYNVKSGPLDGVRFWGILNRSEEKREQDNGESKNYSNYDIKLVLQYDFDINYNSLYSVNK